MRQTGLDIALMEALIKKMIRFPNTTIILVEEMIDVTSVIILVVLFYD